MSLEIGPELHHRLEEIRKARGQPVAELVLDAIRLYLEIQEDRSRARQETLDRWQRFERTGESVSGQAVEAWLSSWGGDEELPCPKPGE